MRRRGPYLLAFLLLLAAETAIGLFVRDRFVRPYLGDVLAAALLCCLAGWLSRTKSVSFRHGCFSSARGRRACRPSG